MSYRPRAPWSPLGPFLFGAGGALVGSSWALPSHAAAGCSVDLTGEDAAGWLGSARVPEIPEGADCESIRLEIAGGSALVTFVTRDGRRAERIVHDPSELGPTLDALGVTGMREAAAPSPERAPPSPEKKPARNASRSSAAPVETDHAPTSRHDAEGSAQEQSAIFALTGGTRGGAENLVTPLLSGSASLSLERWELGVMGALELQYFEMAASSARAPGSALVAGVLAGRRQPLGGATVLVGARLSLAALNDESEVDGGRRGRAEMRAGSYLGVALPSAAKTRFRAEIGAEIVPEDLGGKSADSLEAAITPWWATSLSLGLEFGG